MKNIFSLLKTPRKLIISTIVLISLPLLIYCLYVLLQENERRKQENLNLREVILNNMVFVEGGTFMMGCDLPIEDSCFQYELPRHSVHVSGFYISKFEFTIGLYELIMGEEAPVAYPIKDYDNNHFYTRNDSIILSNHEYPFYTAFNAQAGAIIKVLNKRTRLNFRLPTEAEWEYAARGGKHSKGYIYSGSNILDEVAWHRYNAKGDPMPVGLKKPNELGLYDMSGNMWEMVQDYFDPDYYSVSDSVNPVNLNGRYKVVRGSNCLSDYEYEFRPQYRFFNPGGGWYYPPGFRLCLDSVQLARLTNGEF